MKLIKREWYEIASVVCADPTAYGNWQRCIEKMAEIDKGVVEDANWRIYRVTYEKEYEEGGCWNDIIHHETTNRELFMSWDEVKPLLSYAVWKNDVDEVEQ